VKITKSQLRKIIKEEIGKTLNEDEDSDRRVIQLVDRAVNSFTEIFNPEELSLIADRNNRDMFVHYLFENIQLQMDDAAELEQAERETGEPEVPEELYR
jgi:hypothetical protein